MEKSAVSLVLHRLSLLRWCANNYTGTGYPISHQASTWRSNGLLTGKLSNNTQCQSRCMFSTFVLPIWSLAQEIRFGFWYLIFLIFFYTTTLVILSCEERLKDTALELEYLILECSLKNSVFKTFYKVLFWFWEMKQFYLNPIFCISLWFLYLEEPQYSLVS